MRKLALAVVTVFLVAVSIMFIPRDSAAVPAFARQTGFSCDSCHYQHFPLLNQFGRAFKAGGYTMAGGEHGLIEGSFLSIPAVLNATLITKSKYIKTDGKGGAGTNDGVVQLPGDAALFLAGRVGERIGFTLEVQLTDPDEAAFDSFKVPITVYQLDDGTNFQVIPYTTDGAGAAYGFELLNTGAMMMMRTLENMMDASAQLRSMTATAASGLAFVVNNPGWFVNYSVWTPEHSGVSEGADGYLSYLRAAVMPQYKGWDLGAGFQYWSGTGKNRTSTAANQEDKADAWALDFQAQGNVGPNNMPLGVYLTYTNVAQNETSGAKNVFNMGNGLTGGMGGVVDDKTAWSVLAELGVIPGRATVIAAYIEGDNGMAMKNEDNALTLGGTYLVAQNFQLQLNQTFYDGNKYDGTPANGDQKTMLMLFAAF